MTNSKNPFSSRPWMLQNGCAASTDSKKGLKGVISGGITGGLEIMITYPLEYVKTQLQLDEKGARKKYKGVVDCLKKTVKEKGLFGLYRGLSILIVGSVPKQAIRFGSFEVLKSYFVQEEKLSPRNRMLCGLGAGVMEALFIVTPMETIKVKFINDMRSPKPLYRGLFHGIAQIIKEEGLQGIYKGVLPTVIRNGSNQAIRFFCMESFKDMYRGGDPNKPVPTLLVGLFGAFAGAASVYGNTPVDVIKTRMQGLEAHRYKGFIDCAIQIWKKEGPRAFYKGTVPRLCRICLDVAITFMLYDNFYKLFNKLWP